ncbi:MAG: MATE family efflux transporter [Lachnospiraceae bacterium]|nr:MATE family efflux transporter [Lachnospiraceae bacterium]
MQKDLTKGSALKNIITFSLPFLLSNFLQTFYGMADLFIVGRYNGAASLTGVSIGSQVMHMLTVMIVGLAMGATVLIGRYVGERKEQEKRTVIGNTIIIFLMISVLLMAVLLIFINPIITVMFTPAEAVRETRLYLRICFTGIPFIVAYNVLSSVFRGLGDSKSPMYFVAAACVLNILLDYLFIGYFDMHAAGAAFGTVFSQAASVLIALTAIVKKKLIIVTRGNFHLDRPVVSNIFKIGFPLCIQDGLIQISFIIITVIANSRGVNIAAAVGVVEKIIGFFFLVPSSMLSAISAICSQCIGSRQHERASETLRYGCLIAVGFGIFFTVICQFVSESLLSLFTSEEIVIMYGSQYLKSYVVDCIFAAVAFGFSGYFTAYGYSMISFVHNVISIILVRIPGAYLMSKLYPDNLFPMGIASPLGSLLSAVICVNVYIYLKRRKIPFLF